MINRFTWLLASALAATAATAHHSVPVNFDQSRIITVEGVLTEIKWLNPHSRFRMDVASEDGTRVEWLVEMGSVNAMIRSGFETHLFNVGAPVSITGNPGRRDRVVLLGHAILQDGADTICLGRTCGDE